MIKCKSNSNIFLRIYRFNVIHNNYKQLHSKRSGQSKQPITLTDNAASRIQNLINKRKDVYGIFLDTELKGCNGLSWKMDYITDMNSIPKMTEEVNDKGVRIIISPRALMNVIGTEMDYQEDEISSKFVFNNPNVTSYCGCGESFKVENSNKSSKKSQKIKKY